MEEIIAVLAQYPSGEVGAIILCFIAICLGVYKAGCQLYDRYDATHETVIERVGKLENTIQLLEESDQISIRGQLLDKYEHFSEKGSIDPMTLQFVHEKYDIYKKRGGNSYADDIMDMIDKIPVK